MNMKRKYHHFLLSLLVVSLTSFEAVGEATAKDGSVDIPAFRLPLSSYLSEETKRVLRNAKPFLDHLGDCQPSNNLWDVPIDQVSTWRDCRAKNFKKSALYKDLVTRYNDVSVSEKMIAGIRNEIFLPESGIAPDNEQRVLLQLHGSGQSLGSRIITHLESVPVASLGRYKIVAVDYTLFPEAAYPVHIDESLAVYKELLKHYRPENIGIYGCSAGGFMTSQIVSSMVHENIPLPGAVAIMGGDGSIITTPGDSLYWGGLSDPSWGGIKHIQDLTATQNRGEINRVWKGYSPKDPRINPLQSPSTLREFPPSLLLYGMRDYNVSGGVALHSALIKEGVEADLHIYEGLGHCFQTKPNIPESVEANKVIVRFFDKHLGKSAK